MDDKNARMKKIGIYDLSLEVVGDDSGIVGQVRFRA